MHVVGHPLVEPLGAVGAGVLFPISVYFHMAAEIAPIVENFPTFWTFGGKLFGAFVDRPNIFLKKINNNIKFLSKPI